MALMPDKAGSYLYLADLYRAAGRLDDATAACLKLLKIEAENAAAHYKVGVAFFEQGKYAKAAEHFVRSLQNRPDNAYAHNYLGIMYTTRGHFDKAIVHLSEAIRIKPDFVDAHNNLAFARSQKAKSQQGGAR